MPHFNPIAYGGGGGGGDFIPHHQIISCHSETTQAMAPKLSDFLHLPFLPQFEKIVAKSTGQGGGSTVIFQTRGHEKLET